LARLIGIALLWRVQNVIAATCAIILAVYFSYNAVGRKDFQQVHKGEELPVLYDAGLDDMMGANYSPLVVDYVFPLVVWGIVLYAIFRRRRQSRRSPIQAG
jgi:hypothetical protein